MPQGIQERETDLLEGRKAGFFVQDTSLALLWNARIMGHGTEGRPETS